MAARRCILLFTRGASAEARAKRMASPQVFDLARRRIERTARVAGARLVIADQRGTTFGERLSNAFAAVAARYDEVVVVPVDVPQLSARDVLRAFALLQHHELVLGPCHDGGVYLIAGRAGAELGKVRWLTPHVLDDLRRGDVALLEPLRDVDGESDLTYLAGLIPSSLLAPSYGASTPARCDGVFASTAATRGPPVECGGVAAALLSP